MEAKQQRQRARITPLTLLATASLTLLLLVLAGGIIMTLIDPNQAGAADTTVMFCGAATHSVGGPVIVHDLWSTPTLAPIHETATPDEPPLTQNAAQRDAAQIVGDVARGAKVFFVDAKCAACHSSADTSVLIGPSLKGIAAWGAERWPGMSAEEYARNVILDPEKYITPKTKPGIMPSNFAQTLNPQQIADVVSYILSLK